MKELNIGQLIEVPQDRDAIHIAVAPVVAAEKLSAGDHVGLLPDGTCGEVDVPIGIVDPFLKKSVKAGQKFWLFLYPNTITSLNHVWTHPAFEAQPVAVKSPTEESQQWIEDFCETGADRLSYEDLMDAAEQYELYGEYLIQGGRFESMTVPDEFWTHYAVVKGRAPKQTGSFFSCSC